MVRERVVGVEGEGVDDGLLYGRVSMTVFYMAQQATF
jgi:hypothetical protein